MRSNQIFDVAGKVIVVTGAASGIGYAIAEAMADNDATVVLSDVDGPGLEAAAAQLSARGGEVTTALLDVSDRQAVEGVMAEVVDRHKRLDVVFANAGVTGGRGYAMPEGEIENASMDAWRTCMAINLDGAFGTMAAAARHMKSQKSGSIVVTTSIAALITNPMPSYGYHAAKAGAAHLVRMAARELGPYGVRVNGIAPGPFVTNIGGGRLKDPAIQAGFTASVPMARAAQPDEIKGLALLLASPAGGYITGAIIPIDGGDSA
ncbi:Levodione reductase (plasmid) [Sulfitobacter sp. THAF37]|uniref:SDR family NAD(P)-dependent oxidoreductase n=1 Tax=Sulfitobacter sp. THAF37 TaxID=2587855 RepID=UPI001267B95E|nr:SDR family NAD(P)-dependent oxidoreductase [Sulfitobacter sp. THAF37]QFT60876.1 Levodione reductase [Sulfitobacter sp. THAF37]